MLLETTSWAAMKTIPESSLRTAQITDRNFLRGWEEMAREETFVSLAGLLATSGQEQRALPLATWRKVFEPLGAYTGSAEPERHVSVGTLEERDLPPFEEWIERIERLYSSALRVPVKRCLSAFVERAGPDDSLIDLAIALDSLFGGQQETTFRVSAAVAWLLGEDSDDRLRLLNETTRVYGARSDVVHGREISDQKATEQQRRGERIVLGVLEALFTRRPDLIEDAERAKKLILDVPPAPRSDD
jgi:hypothetical protein